MTEELLKYLANYSLNESRRGSYIQQADIENDSSKCLLDDRRLLDIRENFNKVTRE